MGALTLSTTHAPPTTQASLRPPFHTMRFISRKRLLLVAVAALAVTTAQAATATPNLRTLQEAAAAPAPVDAAPAAPVRGCWDWY